MSPDSRKAALLLHSMSDDDRKWALSKLTPAASEAVGVMLSELCTLGIPREVSLIHQALEEVKSASPKMVSDSLDDTLRDASPELMADVMRGESARMVASLLAIENWSWEVDFLAQLDGISRSEIRRVRESGVVTSVPPAFRLAVLEMIGAKLQSAVQTAIVEHAKEPNPNFFKSLSTRFSRGRH